jgi:hypothetical protein
MRIVLILAAITTVLAAQESPTPVDPPPVDEAALAARLADMTKPAPGERAVILFDPTYYPGITNRLRETLQARGVYTYAIAEDTPSMIAGYIDDDVAHNRRERDIIETWRPVFQRADIFYWMPIRGYGDDLRWEHVVAENRGIRSVHFHWLLPFPGTRTRDEIVMQSRDLQNRALNVNLEEHARNQDRLARLMRGQTLRITTPAGTDLTIPIRRDEWFHFGNGDASRATAAAARWIRDRQIELPVGIFAFVPDPELVTGTLVAPAISQAGTSVRDARFTMTHGRLADLTASAGADWIRNRAREIGPDGDRIAVVDFNTNPLAPANGVGIDIGSNWEHGASNRATRMWRMSIRLRDATVVAGNRTIMRDGRILWSEF